MEVSGIIKKIGDVQEISASFKKRELVVTTEEQYPQHLAIEFVQDKTDILNQYQPGDKVTVGINLRGREWTSPQGEVKYFNSIQGWRIDKTGGGAAPQNQAPAQASSGAAPAPKMPPMPEEDDDLPF
jgi:single-stranded DNA-binding protein